MIDCAPRAILNVPMSKLDENLEALHRKVDAHLEQLAFRRRAIAEAAHSAEPAIAIPDQEKDPETLTESGAVSAPSETPHSSADPPPKLTHTSEPTGSSTELMPAAAEPDEGPAPKPADTPAYETPQPLPVEKGPALPEEDQLAIHPPANDGEVKASLGFFGKIFRRLRWW